MRKLLIIKALRATVTIFLAAAVVNGCATHSDGTVQKIDGKPYVSAAVLEQQTMTVSPDNSYTPPKNYVVGSNDVLLINIYSASDGTLPAVSTAATTQQARSQGSRVDGSGNIQMPLVGSVNVGGLSVEQIQAKLKGIFTRYFREPVVVVEISEYKSQPVHLIGQFKMPGTYYLDGPANVLQGIAIGKGLQESANLRGARLVRDGKVYPVDIYKLLKSNDLAQNVWLKPDDTIYVPDSKDQNVFVLGAVKKPGMQPMINGRLDLIQALANADIGTGSLTSGYVRIIRSYSPTEGELIVIDAKKVFAGKAMPFPLAEGDIVYVSLSPLGNWNEAINEILPTLQAVGAILNPFVQIKYLGD